jgi:hypothetical protein
METTRPTRRSDCADGPRPCPWVSCRYHLYLDVNERTGRIVCKWPYITPTQLDRLPETCALDVAERGGLGHREVGEVLNMSDARAHQLAAASLVQFALRWPEGTDGP